MTALFLVGFVLAYVLGTMQTAWAIKRKRNREALHVARTTLATIRQSMLESDQRARVLGAAVMLVLGSDARRAGRTFDQVQP